MTALKVLVLDTSAYIQGFDPQTQSVYTVLRVREEIKGQYALMRFDNAVKTGRLQVLEPEKSYKEKIEEKTLTMGESHILSETDRDVLALGLQLKEKGFDPVIVSDDYSVQNMADIMELKHKSLATPGISRQFKWIIYCPGCKRTYDQPQIDGVCPVCGTELRRKPVNKKKIRQQGEI